MVVIGKQSIAAKLVTHDKLMKSKHATVVAFKFIKRTKEYLSYP